MRSIYKGLDMEPDFVDALLDEGLTKLKSLQTCLRDFFAKMMGKAGKAKDLEDVPTDWDDFRAARRLGLLDFHGSVEPFIAADEIVPGREPDDDSSFKNFKPKRLWPGGGLGGSHYKDKNKHENDGRCPDLSIPVGHRWDAAESFEAMPGMREVVPPYNQENQALLFK